MVRGPGIGRPGLHRTPAFVIHDPTCGTRVAETIVYERLPGVFDGRACNTPSQMDWYQRSVREGRNRSLTSLVLRDHQPGCVHRPLRVEPDGSTPPSMGVGSSCRSTGPQGSSIRATTGSIGPWSRGRQSTGSVFSWGPRFSIVVAVQSNGAPRGLVLDGRLVSVLFAADVN